jgi:hypothetical protein
MREIATTDIGIKLKTTATIAAARRSTMAALQEVRRKLADQLAFEILQPHGSLFRYTEGKDSACYSIEAIVLSEMQLAQIKQQAFDEGVEWMRNGMAMPR